MLSLNVEIRDTKVKPEAIRKAGKIPAVIREIVERSKLAAISRPEEASTSETTVALWWAWIMGFAVVFVATFGTVIFARVDKDSLPAATPAAALPPPATAPVQAPKPVTAGGRDPVTKEQALADLQRLLAHGTVISSQDELVTRWRVAKGTVSRWISDWEDQGLVARSTEGRCRQIVAA